MKKLLLTLFLLILCIGNLQARTVERRGNNFKAVDIINEQVATGSFFSYSFKEVGDLSLIDFTETSITTANVKFLKADGTADVSTTLTAGTPINNKGYSQIEFKLENNSGTSDNMNGTLKIFNASKTNLQIANSDNSLTNPGFTQLTTGTADVGKVTVNAITNELPAGTQSIGFVTVNAITNELPAGTQSIGFVTVNAITNELPAGTQSIGSVTVNAITTALPAGTNSIGNVSVNALLAELPAGTQSIGSVTVNAITAALPAGTNTLGSVTVNSFIALTPTIYNVTITTANTEYSQLLPDNTLAFEISIIDGVDSNTYVIAFETGKVAAPTAPYLKFEQNIAYFKENINLVSKTIYIGSSANSKTAQIIVWQ